MAQHSNRNRSICGFPPCIHLLVIVLLLFFGTSPVSAQARPHQVGAEQVQLTKLQNSLRDQKIGAYYKSMLSPNVRTQVSAWSPNTSQGDTQQLKQAIAKDLNDKIRSELNPAQQDYLIKSRMPLNSTLDAEIKDLLSKMRHGSLQNEEDRMRLNFLLVESAPGGAIGDIESSLPQNGRSAVDPIKELTTSVNTLRTQNERLEGQIRTLWIIGLSFLLVSLTAACLLVVRLRHDETRWRTTEPKPDKKPEVPTPQTVPDPVYKQPADPAYIQGNPIGWPDSQYSTERGTGETETLDLPNQLRTLLGPGGECSGLIPIVATPPNLNDWEQQVMRDLLDPKGTYFRKLYEITEYELTERLQWHSPTPFRQVLTANLCQDLITATGKDPSFLENAVAEFLRNETGQGNSSVLYTKVKQIAQSAAKNEVLHTGLNLELVKAQMLAWIDSNSYSREGSEIQAAINKLVESLMLPRLTELHAALKEDQKQITERQALSALVQKQQVQTTVALQERQSAMLYEIEARSRCAADVTRFERLAHHLRCSLPEAVADSFPDNTTFSTRTGVVLRKTEKVEADLTEALSVLKAALDSPRANIDLESLKRRVNQFKQEMDPLANSLTAGEGRKGTTPENTDLDQRSSDEIASLYAGLQEGIRQQTERFKTDREIFMKSSVNLCKIAARLLDPLTDIYNCSGDERDSNEAQAWAKLLKEYRGFLRECDVEVFIPLPNSDYHPPEHSADAESYSMAKSEKKVIARTTAPGLRVDEVIEPAKVVVREG